MSRMRDSTVPSARTVVCLLIAIAVGIIAFRLVPQPLPELSQAELLSEVRSGHVLEVHIDEDHVLTGTSTTRGRFRTSLEPNEKEMIKELRALNVKIVFEDSGPGLI